VQKVVYKNSLNPETKIKLDKFFESSNKELLKTKLLLIARTGSTLKRK